MQYKREYASRYIQQPHVKERRRLAMRLRGSGVGKYRAFLMDRDGYFCQQCKALVSDDMKCRGMTAHVDHIIPKARGGVDDVANLQVLCYQCNIAKGAR